MSRQPPRSGQRRSSYASVLSGNPAGSSAAPPRSGFLANQLSEGGPLSQSFPSQQPQAQPSRNPVTASGRSHSDDPNTLMSQTHPFAFSLGPSPLDSLMPEFLLPSYLKNSRHMERLEEKHRAKMQAQRDGKSARSSVTGSLSTSASGVNLHQMVPSHRGMTHEIVERPFKGVRDEVPLAELPSRWSAQDKAASIEVSSDGSEAKFSGSTKTQDEGAAVRADHPIPREVGIYYFEIDILSKQKESQIAIGLSGPGVVNNRMPGWEPKSWAYHGDDGNCFCQTASPKPYGQKFGATDVVGCGVNFRTNTMFFTKNGAHLGTAFREMLQEPLYPSVGFKRPNEQLRVNFGQAPFVYDIDRLVQRERELIEQEIDKEDVSSLHDSGKEPILLQELVAQYLAHDGYTEALKAFASEVQSMARLTEATNEAGFHVEYEEDSDAINRQSIRTAILEGDVEKALKLTHMHYPTVLSENGNIYFKLRCRIFIEMIRQCTELQGPSKAAKSRNGSKGVASNGYGNGTAAEGGVFDMQMELDEDEDVAVEDGIEMEAEQDAFAKQAGLLNVALAYGQELQREFKDDGRREVKQALEDTFALIAYPDARQSSLAPLLEVGGRAPIAEELNSAILVSLGKSSSAVLERLYQQTEVLVSDLSRKGTDGAALINPRQSSHRG